MKVSRDVALAHFLEVFGVTPSAQTQVRAAFATFVSARRERRRWHFEFERFTVECGAPASAAALRGLPASVAKLARRHGQVTLMLARQRYCLLRTTRALDDDGRVLVAWAGGDADWYCVDRRRKNALVFVSHEGGRGRVVKQPLAAVVAKLLAQTARVARTRPAALAPIKDGALELSQRSLGSLRALLERYPREALAGVHTLRCTAPLTSTDGVELLPGLRSAYLDGLRLRDGAGLSQLSALERLSVNDNQLTGLPSVPSLRKLKANVNRLTSMAGLRAMPRLESVDLRGNEIATIEELEALPALREVQLEQRAARRVTAASLTRLVALASSTPWWALSLDVVGPVPRSLRKLVDRARFRAWVEAAHRTGVAALEPVLREALSRDADDLAFTAARAHGYFPLVEERPAWRAFLAAAVARDARLAADRDEFERNCRLFPSG